MNVNCFKSRFDIFFYSDTGTFKVCIGYFYNPTDLICTSHLIVSLCT